MVDYKYRFNPKENKVIRTVNKIYPDLSEVKFNDKVTTDKIKEKLLLAKTGIMLKPINDIESEWFSLLEESYTINDRLSEIDIKLNGRPESVTDTGEIIEAIQPITDTEEINALTIEQSELQTRLKEVNDLITKLEANNKWLTEYKVEQEDDFTYSRPLRPVSLTPDEVKKLIVHERDTTVRNIEDSVADLAKTNALLMSFIVTIYNVLDSSLKDNIPPQEKAVIEYAVSKWSDVQTRGDRQLAEEGLALIDKLFIREVAIADIVDKFKA